LLSRFETAVWAAGKVISDRAIGTLSRPRMLVAAAPTTRKQVMAMMVITFVKPSPVSFDRSRSLAPNLGTN
jgi:hypothetical protein